MKRILVLFAVVALALPAAAVAKGPSGASIDGPGTGSGLKFSGNGESGGTQLGTLTEQAGFFPAMFGQTPDPMQKDRPKGDLGPKYTITWTVPGGKGKTDRLQQDVYPYASPPVTYTKPGQKFFGDMESHGGWFRSEEGLKQTLVSAGLPKSTPSSSSSDSSFFSAGLLSLLGAALLVAMTTAIVMRRRARPAAAA
jgi:hypothetical protein